MNHLPEKRTVPPSIAAFQPAGRGSSSRSAKGSSEPAHREAIPVAFFAGRLPSVSFFFALGHMVFLQPLTPLILHDKTSYFQQDLIIWSDFFDLFRVRAARIIKVALLQKEVIYFYKVKAQDVELQVSDKRT